MQLRDTIDWIAGLSARRTAWLALALSALCLEGAALYFQYGLHLAPCVMCVYIRLAVFGLVGAGLLGAVAPARPFMRVLGLLAWAGAAGEGLSLSRELIRIQEAGPYSLEVTCSFLPKFPSWLPLHHWFPALFLPTGTCTDITWTWLGMSMAQWLQWVFLAYLVVLAVVIVAQFTSRGRANTAR